MLLIISFLLNIQSGVNIIQIQSEELIFIFINHSTINFKLLINKLIVTIVNIISFTNCSFQFSTRIIHSSNSSICFSYFEKRKIGFINLVKVNYWINLKTAFSIVIWWSHCPKLFYIEAFSVLDNNFLFFLIASLFLILSYN